MSPANRRGFELFGIPGQGIIRGTLESSMRQGAEWST
jgi:hypothetical protein